MLFRSWGNIISGCEGDVGCCFGEEGSYPWSELCWGLGKDSCKGGVGESIPGIAVVVKSDPGFLDQDDVGGFVCKVEECLHNVC